MGDVKTRLDEEKLHFLEVGCGTGQMALAMAQRWPRLSSIALEPWNPSVKLARQRIAKYQLEDRVSIIENTIQEYSDTCTVFDFAWIASDFVSETILPLALERIHSHLRPSGWLWLIGIQENGSYGNALAALRSTWWGGEQFNSKQAS